MAAADRLVALAVPPEGTRPDDEAHHDLSVLCTPSDGATVKAVGQDIGGSMSEFLNVAVSPLLA